MAMNFPSSPTVGQTYSVSGGPTYTWDGNVWKVLTPGQQYSPQVFTATAGQTTFTVSGGYVIGAIDVFRNGVKLVSGSDYTATDLATVVLVNACSAGDTVEAITLSQILYSAALKNSNNLSDVSNAATALANLGGVSNTSQLAGNRNKIINGAMMIDQRALGTFTPTTAGSASNYFIDRWTFQVNQSSKLTTAKSSTAPSGFTNSILVTSSSAYTPTGTDYFALTTRLEGLNTADLGFGTSTAATITISFWVRSSLTGTFGANIANSANNRSYPFTYTILVANTWEQKTVTIAGDTSGTWLTTNGVGIELNFSMGMGSTYGSGTAGAWTGSWVLPTGAVSVVGTSGATWYVTGVQLEKGATATPFENRLYGNELLLCQRYALRFGGEVSYEHIGNIGTAYAVNAAVLKITSMVPMRASPSMNYGGTINLCDGNTNIAMTSAVLGSGGAEVSTKNFGIVAYTSGGMTIYRPYYLITANTSAYFIFSAEL